MDLFRRISITCLATAEPDSRHVVFQAKAMYACRTVYVIMMQAHIHFEGPVQILPSNLTNVFSGVRAGVRKAKSFHLLLQ
jgi:hypothetical protein